MQRIGNGRGLGWCAVLAGCLGLGAGTAAGAEPAASAPAFELPARRLAYTGRSAQDFKPWQEAARAHLATVLFGKADYRQLVEFRVAFESADANEGKDHRPAIEKVSEQEHYTLYRVNYMATDLIKSWALLAVPKAAPAGGKGFPAILAIHGHESGWGQADENAFTDPHHIDSFAGYFAERGFVVMFPAILNHSVTKRGSEGWTLMGAWVAETLRCVDYLKGRSDIVDSQRIGCVGLSTGAFLAMLTSALQPEVRATVAAGCFSTWNYDETGFRCPPGCTDEDFSLKSGVHDLDYPELAGLSAPRALLLMHGHKDEAYSPDYWGKTPDPKWQIKRMNPAEIEASFAEAQRLFGVAGSAEKVKLVFHPAGHAVDNVMAYEWITRHLGAPAADAGQRP